MQIKSSGYAAQLRQELGSRNRLWARGRAHVESYGDPPVIVYAPQDGSHGNFFLGAYQAITACPEWLRRFDKIHAQGRALPKAESGRRWRELDSSMSSDALLMNVFCTPGVAGSPAILGALGVDADQPLLFGWKARVPLTNGRFDRTEVDLRLGSLLIEAKLTEGDFQTREAAIVEGYRDFDAVFHREMLPRVELVVARRREPTESPEDYSQEFESFIAQEPGSIASTAARQPDLFPSIAAPSPAVPRQPEMFPSISAPALATPPGSTLPAYTCYQLIRNVLAAHAEGCSFCVIHDQRRPDLREQWFQVMAAVKSAGLRVRLAVLTWQELAALLPPELQHFLDVKYGIVIPGQIASPPEPPPD